MSHDTSRRLLHERALHSTTDMTHSLHNRHDSFTHVATHSFRRKSLSRTNSALHNTHGHTWTHSSGCDMSHPSQLAVTPSSRRMCSSQTGSVLHNTHACMRIVYFLMKMHISCCKCIYMHAIWYHIHTCTTTHSHNTKASVGLDRCDMIYL